MASVSAPTTASPTGTQLPPLVQLMRFLYLNNDKCSYAKVTPISLENIQQRLNCVVAMAEARPDLPISIITKAYENKHTIRVDESLVALAFCTRQEESEQLRNLAYSAALNLLTTQHDFFLFVKYCTDISVKLRGDQRKGWASGMRKCVNKWYAKFTPMQLVEMFGEHRGLHKWTHRDFWNMAHIKNETAAPATDNAAEGSAVTSALVAPSERILVAKFIFSDGQSYLTYLESFGDVGTLPPAAKRMHELQMFKTNENIESAIEQIKHFGFTLGQTPAHLLHHASVWDALLPSMSYHELLDNLFTIKDTNSLNESNPFLQKYLSALNNLKKCTVTKPSICPFRVFLLKQNYEKNLRYFAVNKADKYEKKMSKRHIKPVEGVTRQLNVLLEHTLKTAKPIPAKFFITIDLKKSNEKKNVIHNKNVTCLDAMALLAYSIFRREQDVQLFSFSEQRNALINLNNMPRTTFQAAKAFLQEKLLEKTSEDLKIPIKFAVDAKQKIDVFVVVVDSVARFRRDGRAPLQEFADYKKNVNPGAKYIVVNLARKEPDLKYLPTEDPKSMLEICGFEEYVPKLINALARNCFS